MLEASWPLSIMSDRQMAYVSAFSSCPKTSRRAWPGFSGAGSPRRRRASRRCRRPGRRACARSPGLASSSSSSMNSRLHHQPDDLAGREVLAGRLVRQLREPPDQLLVQVAHLQVRHGVGVEVDLGELRHHEVEQVRAVEPGDLSVEVELLDDVASRGREASDVAPQVVRHVGRVVEQLADVELGRVVERLARRPRKIGSRFSPCASSRASSTLALVGSSTQSRRRMTTSGRITRPYSDCL